MGGHGRGVARIAVSGAGWWGQGWHLPHLSRHPDAMIAAIVEPNPSPVSSNAAQVLESTAQLSSRYSAPVYGSVGELLASTTELDGLLVGSPHASHFADGMLAIEARLPPRASRRAPPAAHQRLCSDPLAPPLRPSARLHLLILLLPPQAGVHVLMEKPMTTSVDEACALAAAARAHTDAGRFFAVNNTANWRPATRTASAAVAAGRVGRVQHVAARMHSPLLWLFDEPANAGWVAPTGDMVGNGFGWGQLSHLLAWCFEVSGLQPEAAFTSMQHSTHTGADLHVAAVVTCVGGASIALSGSAGLPGDAHGDAPVGKQIEVSVFGTEGSLRYGGDDQRPASGALELRRHDAKPAHEVLSPSFLFENYEPSGAGPESLHALVDACVGRPALVSAAAEMLGGSSLQEGYRATGLAP
eukprot:scaffold18942_cov63-Phaeocystis_antarctica.AAC.6